MKIYLYSIWQTEFQYNFQLNLCSAYKAPHTKHITSFILIATPRGSTIAIPISQKRKQAQRSRKTWPRSHYEQSSQLAAGLAQAYLLTCLLQMVLSSECSLETITISPSLTTLSCILRSLRTGPQKQWYINSTVLIFLEMKNKICLHSDFV